jgi:rhomboid protease GluP
MEGHLIPDEPTREYTQEISLGNLAGKDYQNIAREAVINLRWRPVGIPGMTIICQTEYGNNSFGEEVTIIIEDNKAIFKSRYSNEHYWVDGQNELNAVLFKNAVKSIIDAKEKGERNKHPNEREPLGALIPSKTYLLTPILIYLNALVFIILAFKGVSWYGPSAAKLLECGGNFRPSVLNGEWWRLFTYMFLHSGIFHLLMNIYALLYIGMFLEPLFGRFRLLSAYLLTGICAGLLSIIMHPYSVGVGASGAIFGLYGVFLAMLTTSHIEKAMRNTLLRSILFFVVLNLMNGLSGNIDNAAHIGGLLSGMIIGYIYYPGLAKKQAILKQIGTTAVITISVVILAAVTLSTLPNVIAIYAAKTKQRTKQARLALAIYETKDTAPKDSFLKNMTEKGIYYWKDNLRLLNELENLGLPPVLKEKNDLLVHYNQLELKLFELECKAISEATDAYEKQIEDSTKIIDSLLGEINK